MSQRYKGGVISATPPTLVAGAGASGTWTLEQQMQATAAGLWPVNGPFYIEEVFSTYLYTGNGSTQTITNGIDLSTYGGLVWIKNRTAGFNHNLQSTGVGFSNAITSSATTYASTTDAITGFNTTGFNLGSGATYGWTNDGGSNYVSWSFRKQAKFFDVVTWTGNGTAGRTISHNLGSVPGAIFVKRLSNGYDWEVYHTSIGNNKSLVLNDVAAAATRSDWNNTTPTSTQFTVGSTPEVNASGGTYVAYLFAHDAGGFGLTGSDNVISCGSFSGNTTVTLGYEPQWIMLKRTDAVGNWDMHDVMRGWPVSGDAARLRANLSDAESQTSQIYPNATGFSTLIGTGNYIYIAIRRGPMKVPTSGTSVFAPALQSASSTAQTKNYGITTDSVLALPRNQASYQNSWWSRLQGANRWLSTASTDAENTSKTDALIGFDAQTGVRLGVDSGSWVQNTANWVHYPFQRAPGFFDEVCYTGTGSATTFNHNLGVVPEMMIVKRRSSSGSDWWVYNAPRGATKSLRFTDEAEFTLLNIWNNTAPTSSVFTVGADSAVNGGSSTYVWYGFATLAGVSKVGTYTGTGTTKQIDCGFTGGARFVLIKRTDSTGDWYVWDSARGIVAGNDPYLLLNSTAAEVTNTDYVDTYSAGFEISSTAPAAINASGGTFIFLAIA